MANYRFTDDQIEAFCQAIVRTGSQAASLREAFVETRTWDADRVGKKAWRLMKTRRVRDRIAQLRRDESILAITDLRDLAMIAAASGTDPATRRMAARVVAAGLGDLCRRQAAGEPTTEVIVAVNAAVTEI